MVPLMERTQRWVALLIVLLVAITVYAEGPRAGRDSARGQQSPVLMLTAFSGSKAQSGGIEVRSGKAVMDITALRENVLRVRIGRSGEFPEDASWAVLPEARQARISVTPDSGPSTVGFRTQFLRAQIDKATLRLTVRDLQGNVLQEDAPGWPTEFHDQAFRIYKRMPEDEHYFGLGDKPGPLDRRNQAITLWNTDAANFQESTGPLYKAIPFFLAVRHGRTLGVFLDNTWRSSFDFGSQLADVYSFGADGGPIVYYLIYGPDAKTVLSTYAWLTGPPPLPPLWSLGYQQSRYSYETETELRRVAGRLRSGKIPSDAIYLDIDYQQENRPFTVDKTRFPHFTSMIADLKKDNFHVVAITDLHIARLPDAGYSPYDTGTKGDHFVKGLDGSVFVGGVWPGPAVFPDFTRQSSREWWGSLYRSFVADGLAGFWNDMNEPSIFTTPNKTMPLDAQHRIDEPGFKPRTASHREVHNIVGLENARATYEGLLKISPDVRPFVLTRATYAGGQRYGATWTGDNSSTWNHLRLTTPMLLNMGLSGFGMIGADVGGFVGTPTADLLTKWIELATFQPIDRNHTEKGSGQQEPWVHGPMHEGIRRRYIEERYRLLPYLYTTAEEMSRTGLPIVRPLFLEFPDAAPDGHPLDLDVGNEFLFGPDLLVAPPRFPDSLDDYQVVLPTVAWYDYWSGERVQRRPADERDVADPMATITPVRESPSLEVLPVFVREGSIIPLQPLTQNTAEVPQGPLTLRVYPGKNCAGSIYQDDGNTFAYRHSEFLRMQFSCDVLPNGVKVHVGAHEGSYSSWWKQLKIEIYGWESGGAEVLPSEVAAGPATSDPAHHMISVTIPDAGKGTDLEIRASGK